jgi:CheY-like chemotaxis protein
MQTQTTVYLIDDDEDDRILLGEAIGAVMEDAVILEFENAYEFYLQMETLSLKTRHSLILLDMNMPKMDGMELLRILRRHPTYGHIPVAIISTTVNQMLVRETRELGIEAYLAKPESAKGLSVLADTVLEIARKAGDK